MIIDSHCHAWTYWPYEPPVPDPTNRGTIEQLIFEMDQNGVDQAAVVCARIDHNPDNNDYIAQCVKRFPERLHQIADVDCSWSETYHTPGAAQRLTDSIDRYRLKGFTHYVMPDDDGAWFLSSEGQEFFRVAEARRQIVSIALPAHLQPVLRQIAERYPSVPFVCHHLAGARGTEPEPHLIFADITRSANLPNIYLKLSGFHYASAVPWEYPYHDCTWVIRGLCDSFGPSRMCWGSDFPLVRHPRNSTSYRLTLEAFRTHCDFISEADQTKILGDNLAALLAKSGGLD